MSREQIAAVALARADADGLAAVSMARVASALGHTTMSLYRYVRSKDELVGLVVDAAVGEPPDLRSARSWREGLEHWARAAVDCFARHHWLLGATAYRDRALGPHERDWLDTALAAIAPLGLDDTDARAAVLLVLGHVRTCVQYGPEKADGSRQATTSTVTVSDQAFAFGLGVVLDGLDHRAAGPVVHRRHVGDP